MPPGYGTSHLRRHLINHHQIVVDAPNSGPLGDSVADLIILYKLHVLSLAEYRIRTSYHASAFEPSVLDRVL